MRLNTRRSGLLLLALTAMALLLGGAAHSWAAAGPELVLQGVEHYELADFDLAQETLGKALAGPGMTPALKAKAHLYLGLVALAQGNRDQARQSFAQVRAADPSYQPDERRLPPEAMRLFQESAAGGSAGGTGQPSGQGAGGGQTAEISQPKPPATPPPPPLEETTLDEPAKPQEPAKPTPRGYVVAVEKGALILDMGGKHGVKQGQRFQVFREKAFTHPVTKQKLIMREDLGLAQVESVQDDLSMAKRVSGKKEIKPGDRLEEAAAPAKPKPKPKPKPPVKAKPKPKPKPKPKAEAKAPPKPKKAPQARLAVLPPVSYYEGADRGRINAERLCQALGRQRKLGLTCRAVSAKELAALEKEMGFDPAKFLLESGVTLRSITALFSSDEGYKSFANPTLKPQEVYLLGQVMKKLGVQAVLIWGFREDTSDHTVRFVYNLHEKGQEELAAYATLYFQPEDTARRYLPEMISGIAEQLAETKD